jgi:hypothetical protein
LGKLSSDLRGFDGIKSADSIMKMVLYGLRFSMMNPARGRFSFIRICSAIR